SHFFRRALGDVPGENGAQTMGPHDWRDVPPKVASLLRRKSPQSPHPTTRGLGGFDQGRSRALFHPMRPSQVLLQDLPTRGHHYRSGRQLVRGGRLRIGAGSHTEVCQNETSCTRIVGSRGFFLVSLAAFVLSVVLCDSKM
ncbi:hypothetical protein TNIN_22851, partial [Trichonephila inaurata madagascariensis]